jgi:hypothetical protein
LILRKARQDCPATAEQSCLLRAFYYVTQPLRTNPGGT